MLLVGLTGGIGSGKSTVSNLLAKRGAIIVDADQIGRDLQRAGSPMVDAMAAKFGDQIVTPDGVLDRAAVATIVFGESDKAKQALSDLNAITHPAIQDEIKNQVEAQSDTDHIVVLDFPLLGENPRDDLGATVVVDISHDVAVDRLVNSRGMDEVDARNRISSQIGREQRLQKATHVIDNSGDLDSLETQVGNLWKQLIELRDGVAQ